MDLFNLPSLYMQPLKLVSIPRRDVLHQTNKIDESEKNFTIIFKHKFLNSFVKLSNNLTILYFKVVNISSVFLKVF